jgi:hypothetical protein
MDEELISWLCGVLDNIDNPYAIRIDAGIVLLQQAARMRSTTGVTADKKLGVTLAVAVRAKLAKFALEGDSSFPLELRIRAAGAAL